MGTNGAVLTLARLDELIDLVKPGRPDLLLMSKRSRRGLTSLVRSSGAFLETHQTEFGTFQEFYAGIPIGVSDYISDADTQGSANNASRIYALTFGEMDPAEKNRISHRAVAFERLVAACFA